MWICPECETKNGDGDSYCACCGEKKPVSTPRPARTQEPVRPAAEPPKANAQQRASGYTPPQPAAPQPAAYTPVTPSPPKSKPLSVGAIIVLVILALLVWRVVSVKMSPESEYTDRSVKYDKVYVDVVKMEPIGAHAVMNGKPTYVVCRCTREDRSSFVMFIGLGEYMRKFDKNITFNLVANYAFVEEGKTLSFSPALRIHGEVYDAYFLYGDNAEDGATVLEYKSSK